MPSADKTTTINVLDPYLFRVRAVVERAWNEWLAVREFCAGRGFAPLLYSRTVANFVFDRIAYYAIREFASDDSISVKIDAQTVKFIFKGTVIARFKKGDDNRLGRNIKTQAALDFIDPNVMLPDMPPETAKIEFIWLPNELGTEIERVLVVARDNDRLVWDHEIPPDAGGAEIVDFPQPDDGGMDDDLVVTPRKPDVKDDIDEE